MGQLAGDFSKGIWLAFFIALCLYYRVTTQ